ncbi:MAG: TraR/DksA family transcriptional regulator [Pirellulales bacterium]
MNADQLRRFRKELEALAMRVRADADALSEQVQSGSGQSGSLSTVPVHLGDMGTEEFLQELNATLLDNQQYLVDEARAALRRIDAGTFGKCETCGKPVAKARLEAMPFTRFCVGCAALNGATPEVNLNAGRPRGPQDTLAPEGEMEEDRRSRRRPTMDARDRPVVNPDIYAAGTAGGGTAVGGLAGSNEGHGDPRVSELQEATGSGMFDADDGRDEDDLPTSGPSGGAVGGTPARKRSSGKQHS